MSVQRMFSILSLLSVMSIAACGGGPTQPSSGAIATMQVGAESFRVWLQNSEQIEAAGAAQAGGPASIPSGRIVMGTEYNTGWRWHLEDVTFAEVTIELCDGRPSSVEEQGTSFGGGRFCPWKAKVVDVDEI